MRPSFKLMRRLDPHQPMCRSPKLCDRLHASHPPRYLGILPRHRPMQGAVRPSHESAVQSGLWSDASLLVKNLAEILGPFFLGRR